MYMQRMLDNCAEKFEKIGSKFNVAKCVAVIVGINVIQVLKIFLLYNQVLPWGVD